jgi:16S rRNA G527 N7-methylase RsmG
MKRRSFLGLATLLPFLAKAEEVKERKEIPKKGDMIVARAYGKKGRLIEFIVPVVSVSFIELSDCNRIWIKAEKDDTKVEFTFDVKQLEVKNGIMSGEF